MYKAMMIPNLSDDKSRAFLHAKTPNEISAQADASQTPAINADQLIFAGRPSIMTVLAVELLLEDLESEKDARK